MKSFASVATVVCILSSTTIGCGSQATDEDDANRESAGASTSTPLASCALTFDDVTVDDDNVITGLKGNPDSKIEIIKFFANETGASASRLSLQRAFDGADPKMVKLNDVDRVSFSASTAWLGLTLKAANVGTEGAWDIAQLEVSAPIPPETSSLASIFRTSWVDKTSPTGGTFGGGKGQKATCRYSGPMCRFRYSYGRGVDDKGVNRWRETEISLPAGASFEAVTGLYNHARNPVSEHRTRVTCEGTLNGGLPNVLRQTIGGEGASFVGTDRACATPKGCR